MTDLKLEAVQRAMKMLDAVNAQYGIIYNDEKYGSLVVYDTQQRKRNWVKYPRGATRKHYLPYLENMRPGDEVEIPNGGFDIRTLSSNASAACVHMWGKGSHITKRNDANGTVKVLRLF